MPCLYKSSFLKLFHAFQKSPTDEAYALTKEFINGLSAHLRFFCTNKSFSLVREIIFFYFSSIFTSNPLTSDFCSSGISEKYVFTIRSTLLI